MRKPIRSQALRRIAIATVGLGAAVAATWTYRNRKLFTLNDITTGDSLDYPELRAHVYFASPQESTNAAEQAIVSLVGFRTVKVDRAECIVLCEADVENSNFIKDIEVCALPLGPSHTRVVVRSRSRSGRGNLGENSRHIRAVQAAMDAILVGG